MSEKKIAENKIVLDPRLQTILPLNITNIFLSIINSDEPLCSDSEYLQHLECHFIFMYELAQVKQNTSREIIKDIDVGQVVKNSLSLMKEMKRMIALLKVSAKKRVSKCCLDPEESKNLGRPLAPRFVRLSKELDFSDLEELAFGFVLVCEAGSYFPFYENFNAASVAGMGLYCGMSPEECMGFLNPKSKHIENGLVEVESGYQSIISKYTLKMPKPCVHALVGSVLSADEFLKIDKTALARILQKEPNFKLYNPEDEKKAKSENEEVEGEGEEDEKQIVAEIAELGDETNKEASKKKESDGKFDLRKFIDQHIHDGVEEEVLQTPDKVVENVESFLSPYKNNIEYLDDRFCWVATRIKIQKNELEKDEDQTYRMKERTNESILRELRAKERMLTSKCARRLSITKSIPRLELLAKKRGLSTFEKNIVLVLVGLAFSQEVRLASESGGIRGYGRATTVGIILDILSNSLEERIKNRSYFYKNSKLVSDGMITITDLLRADLMELEVSIDRRMLDFIVGLETEFSEIVEGSNLFEPNVRLDQVILPAEQKKLIVETVQNFEAFQRCRKRLGFDEVVSYGNSLVLLFYGESGTGKTMTANALANHLGKKLLLINFSNLGDNAGCVMRYIFRESKINDALLFFDECEAFFEKRDKYNSKVVPFLTELERHDGLVIMATNLPHELDEAMHRRITLAIEFMPPDPILREKIWKNHFPKDIKLEEHIDWPKLSLNYELTGGLIKNAVLSALSFAIARDGGEDPTICEVDLIKGAKHQLRGIFTMNAFDRRVIPKHGLADIILAENVEKRVLDVIQFEKARKVLFSQWGFGKLMDSHRGTSVLFFGKPGTGKKKAAEALGFELGCAIKSVDLAEILSKYIYNTTKNIEKLFSETRKTGAVLLIEITSITSELMKESMAQLLSNISKYRGIVIVVTNLEGMITQEFTSSFKFVLEFEKPSEKMRYRIWKKLIPPEMPVAGVLDLKKLAARFDFSGGNIENVLVRAAARTALLKGEKAKVSQKVLERSCEEELANAKFRSASNSMYQ